MTVGAHDPADVPTERWKDWRIVVKHRLSDPRLIALLNIDYWVNFDYDVGYVCGMDTSLRGFYCDLNVPLRAAPVGKNNAPVNLVPFVWLHECGEWFFIEVLKDPYEVAHQYITVAEHDAVVQAGINWRRYSAFFDAYDRRTEDTNNIKRTPRTLYLQPYKEEFAGLLLQRMYATMT